MSKNKPENYLEEYNKMVSCIDDMKELIWLTWLLIFDTKNMTDSERVEKIWNAVNLFYDKWEWQTNVGDAECI